MSGPLPYNGNRGRALRPGCVTFLANLACPQLLPTAIPPRRPTSLPPAPARAPFPPSGTQPQKGFAALINPENGYNYAAEPNMRSFIYDPAAPKGRRYTEMGSTRIMRLYHSVACLHHTGEVVVAGCETCARSVGGLVSGAPAVCQVHTRELLIHMVGAGHENGARSVGGAVDQATCGVVCCGIPAPSRLYGCEYLA